MIVTMKVMEKMNRKSWILYIVMALITPCLSSSQLYATVYAGVPVWEDASPILFCASDANLTSTEKHNVWASQSCVPTDPTPHEYPLHNVTDYFNIWKNYMVDQMHEDIIDLWDQSLKPCVEMTFLCVQMNCTEEQNVTDLLTNALKCDFNVTTILKDKKEKKQALFYKSDLIKINSTEGNTYTLINCNSTTIKQACPKVSFEPIPIHYCAPAGYAIFKCNSINFNGTGMCSNITVVTCTHGIKPAVSTQLILNGTLSKGKIRIMGKNISNTGKNILVTLNSTLSMTCVRTGNQTVQQMKVGPMAWYSMAISQEKNDTRKAYCTYNATDWETALKQTAERYLELVNYTGSANITFNSSSGGDVEITHLHFNCHGEFFYCNTAEMFNYTFKCKGATCNSTSLENNGTSNLTCKIRQVVRSWMKQGSGLYAPPIRGNLACMSNITGIILQLDTPWNNSKENTTATFRPTGGDMTDIWRTQLFNYKVVRVKPFSVAPTKIARPVIGTGNLRQKRAVGLGMLFLGVLSAAGSTMGAAATALAVQTHTLMKGIVQQQDNLLRAIQAQQHLLRLSVWGIRQLRARLLALETFVKNQQLLNLWGCKGRLVCYTSVQWNRTWVNNTDLEHIWENLTWQEWDQQVNNISSFIFEEIQRAQVQQEQNEKKLLELDEWASIWNWLDITKWLWYIKIAIIIVGALVGVRVVMIVLNLVKNIRQGYQPLSLQTPVHHQPEVETPGGTGEGGGEGDRPKLIPSPQGFLPQLYTDLRTIILWSYHLLSNLASVIQKLIRHLGLGLWILGQKTIEACRIGKAVIQYWLQELQNSATNLIDTLAVAVANWTDGIILGLQRIGRGILNIPRRIRQGLEIGLL
ncbi:envelope glycoprotein [Human immunodeficiency virus 1]|uniref:Envelope glycoprotein gp160 n=1 Tax=Human immunodeficiency virus type 1 TaxID=11676 RepID=A0A0U4FFW0_HV1|nr:envelope glycoprotein [Human immunodeficiency virus 1]